MYAAATKVTATRAKPKMDKEFKKQLISLSTIYQDGRKVWIGPNYPFFFKKGRTEVPVVFLHGLRQSHKMFLEYPNQLDVQAYIPDLRNHGKSERIKSMDYVDQACDVHQLLEDKGVEKAIFVGHGLGGKVAMMYATLFPDQVVGVCSMDSPPININKFPEFQKVPDQILWEYMRKQRRIEKGDIPQDPMMQILALTAITHRGLGGIRMLRMAGRGAMSTQNDRKRAIMNEARQKRINT